MTKYTSLKLSKMFNEVGFKRKSENYYSRLGYFDFYGERKEEDEYIFVENDGSKLDKNYLDKNYYPVGEKIFSYDILNDICVKYAKEVWGEYKEEDNPKDGSERITANGYIQATNMVFDLIRAGKPKEEIENYIIKNSPLFNK